jgi:hypothetical protein
MSTKREVEKKMSEPCKLEVWKVLTITVEVKPAAPGLPYNCSTIKRTLHKLLLLHNTLLTTWTARSKAKLQQCLRQHVFHQVSCCNL